MVGKKLSALTCCVGQHFFRLCMTLSILAILAGAYASGKSNAESELKITHGGPADEYNDVIAHVAKAFLGERLSESVSVERKTGVSHGVAMATVANAAPDGHTVGLLSSDIAVQAGLSFRLSFDAGQDFAPINRVPSLLFYDLRRDFATVGTLTKSPLVFVVRSNSPHDSFQGLIDSAIFSPGSLKLGYVRGTTQHLAGELFTAKAGIRWKTVPYADWETSVADLMAGRLDVLVDSFPSLKKRIESGSVRALAVTSLNRWPTLPAVPAISETLSGFEVMFWTGLVLPAATPTEVRERFTRELNAVLASEAFTAKVRQLGGEPFSIGPVEMKKLVDQEIARWRSAALETGVSLH